MPHRHLPSIGGPKGRVGTPPSMLIAPEGWTVRPARPKPRPRDQPRDASMPLQAATSPFTASIDFCSIACSARSSVISITR